MGTPRLPTSTKARHVYTFRVSPARWRRFREALRRDGRVASHIFARAIDDFLREYEAAERQ